MTAITPIVAANCHALPAVTFISRADAAVQDAYQREAEDNVEAIHAFTKDLRALWDKHRAAIEAVDEYHEGFEERLAKLMDDDAPEAWEYWNNRT